MKARDVNELGGAYVLEHSDELFEDMPMPAATDDAVVLGPNGNPYLVTHHDRDLGWYVLAPEGGYLVSAKAQAATVLRREWPDLPTTNADGKPLTLGDLFAAYGVQAEAVSYSYTGATRYRPIRSGRGELAIGLRAPRQVRPAHHPDVAEWLRRLGGEKADRLLDWLATVHLLDRPTCALLVIGPKSAGKSMLAAGVAEYLSGGHAAYDDVFGSHFNAALLEHPLVWLDEKATREASSAAFRKLVGNDTHAVTRKGLPSVTLHGCPRLIVTANGQDPLKLGREDLDEADEDAIGERVLRIDVADDAGGYLAGRGGRSFTAEWVRRSDGFPGLIAEHLAWLAATRAVKRGDRFLVHGDAAEWARTVGLREGLPSTILEVIRGKAGDSRRIRDRSGNEINPFLFHQDGSVMVYTQPLAAAWPDLAGGSAPTSTALGRALKKLGVKERTTDGRGYRIASDRWRE